MQSVIELLDVSRRLSEANRFAVLVYARFKFARQLTQGIPFCVGERRRPCRVNYPRAHWMM
jgi:hypothetical protein